MKKLFATIAFSLAAIAPLSAADITHEIPEIQCGNYERVPNVAQYGHADWNQVVGIARGITVEKAEEIADENPEITYFFYTTGCQMVLETEDGNYRVFRHGDTVFFAGEPWWGSAPGLADGYIKIA